MTHLRRLAFIMAVLCAGATALAADGSATIAGGESQAWLVATEPGGGYRLAARTAVANTWEDRGTFDGQPVAASALAGGGIVVFFANGDNVSHFSRPSEGSGEANRSADSQRGVKCPAELWPANSRLLSACPGEKLSPGILTLLLRPAKAALTATTSRAAISSASSPAEPRITIITSAPASRTALGAQDRQLVILAYAGNWSNLLDVPADGEKLVQARMAVFDRTVYVLVQDPLWHLLACTDGRWSQVPLPEGVGNWRMLALEAFNGQVIVAGFQNQDKKMLISRRPVASGQWQSPQDVAIPAAWGEPAAVGRIGDRLAVAASAKTGWQSGSITVLDGQFRPGPDVFEVGIDRASAEKAIETYYWVALGLIIVLMFMPGQIRTAPFSLPPGVRPGNLLRRGFAFVIDAFPIMAIVVAVIGPVPMDLVKFTWDDVPPVFAYYSIGFSALFLAYSITMEFLRGATVGKMLMGLRVVGDGARRATLREVALRNILKVPEFFGPSPFLLPLFLLFPILTRYRQRIGDKLAWTAVVDAASLLPLMRPPPTDAARPMDRD